MMQAVRPATHRARWARRTLVAGLAFAASTLATGAGVAPDSGERPDAHPHARAREAMPRPQVGLASVYARMLQGNKTASGEKHDGNELVAAHRTLPLGTIVKVTNLANRRSVLVRINDRGPMVTSRIIDLSPNAAAQIGLRARGRGLARVRLEVVEPPQMAAHIEDKP